MVRLCLCGISASGPAEKRGNLALLLAVSSLRSR